MSDFAYPLHEECGVFGIYDRAGTEDVLSLIHILSIPAAAAAMWWPALRLLR